MPVHVDETLPLHSLASRTPWEWSTPGSSYRRGQPDDGMLDDLD